MMVMTEIEIKSILESIPVIFSDRINIICPCLQVTVVRMRTVYSALA